MAAVDPMQEKLERWRQMKGRTKTAGSVAFANVNRSRASFALTKMSANLNISKKSKIKELPVNTHVTGKVKTGCKRTSDHSSKLAGVVKRSKTLPVIQRKPLPERGAHHNNRENINLEANENTYKDKTLSMRERLELWRSEKRKGHSSTLINDKKLEKLTKGPTQVSGLKENVPSYHKLAESTNRFYKSSLGRPLLHNKRKPTTERKLCLAQSTKKCSMKKSCKYEKLDSKLDGKDKMAEIQAGSEMKSYKDKTLDLSERLELWLAAKGKTPKFKTPAILKSRRSIPKNEFQEKRRLSFSISEELVQGEATGVISPDEGENVEEQLQKCLQQLEKGECDPDRAAAKLDLYNSSCPHTSQIAFYWLCRAKIAERERDYDRAVCLFEQAFVFKAQPESLIRDAVCAFVKTMKEHDVKGSTDDASEIPLPSPMKDSSATDVIKNSPDNLNSSVIKFCLTEATPYRKRFKSTFGKSVLTPVRRSVRLERASIQHPTLLQEHDLTVRSLGELPESVHDNLWFKPNFAVQAELNEAWSKLQQDCNQ